MTHTFSGLKLCEICGNTMQGGTCLFCGKLTTQQNKSKDDLKCGVCGILKDIFPVHFKTTKTKWFCEKHYRDFINDQEKGKKEAELKNRSIPVEPSASYVANISKIKSLLGIKI